MAGRMILYRGSLKSCNYRCSYCPFSKHAMSRRELCRDREQWLAFVENFRERAGKMGIRALMAAPYGEALIHPWYWEGLARISAMAEMDAVGAQTNLSFSIERCLADFARAGGVRGKLRLWATFHPEMTTIREFAGRCRELWQAGVTLCAGAVGVPENLGLLGQLRDRLPKDIYLWINAMDGLGRPYTPQEVEAFCRIDPCFARELAPVPADVRRCKGRLFVEGDGRMRVCNIGRALEAGWEDFGREDWEREEEPYACGRKRCSCYLAYGGRDDFWNRILFGSYPLFRILRRPKAVFLDIEGTLWEEGGISVAALAGLDALARQGIPLFFATTLPREEAMRRCREVCHLFRGGIFAGGAHLRLEASGTGDSAGTGKGTRTEEAADRGAREYFYEMDEGILSALEALNERRRFRILGYRDKGRLYKITLQSPSRRPWEEREAERIFRSLPACGEGLRYYVEGNRMQIVRAEADKAGGVRTLCRWLGIAPEDAAAAGNSGEDAGMVRMTEC